MSAINDDTIDSEIVDIFVEEATEVLKNIDKYLPIWKDRPADRGALAEIRRGFHTLKGSGRMVKALDLGELAWKVENMLNRVVDGTISVSGPMVKLVATTRNVMPRLLDAFQNQKQIGMDTEIDALMSQADVIAAGQTPKTAPARPPQTPGFARDTQGVQLKIDDLNRRFERQAQRADEALHRAEMSLQQVRRLGGQIKNIEREVQESGSRADITQISGRMEILSKELLQIRKITRELSQQAAVHPRELHQVIDRRVSDKLAPMERMQAGIQRQLEDNRQAASSSRRMAVTALILLIAGAAAGAFIVFAGPA